MCWKILCWCILGLPFYFFCIILSFICFNASLIHFDKLWYASIHIDIFWYILIGSDTFQYILIHIMQYFAQALSLQFQLYRFLITNLESCHICAKLTTLKSIHFSICNMYARKRNASKNKAKQHLFRQMTNCNLYQFSNNIWINQFSQKNQVTQFIYFDCTL